MLTAMHQSLNFPEISARDECSIRISTDSKLAKCDIP